MAEEDKAEEGQPKSFAMKSSSWSKSIEGDPFLSEMPNLLSVYSTLSVTGTGD